MKPGRLVTVVAIAMLLVGGLTACRADPSVAAYVDDTRITQAEVDNVVESLSEVLTTDLTERLVRLRELVAEVAADQEAADAQYAEAEQAERASLADDLARARNRVVEMRILTIVATEYARAEGLTVPEPALEHHAAQLGLPADQPYVAVVAEFYAAMGVLQGQVEPVEPTEEDRREIYDKLVAGGLTGVPYEEAREVLNAELVGEAVGMRNQIRAALDRVQLQINPRYDLVYQVPVGIAGANVSLAIPLGDRAVVDAR